MTRARLHSITYLPALDGMRAVSILLVVLSHFGLGWVIPGGLGVTIFFFISGFIITQILLQEAERRGDVSLRAFYIKRFFRLAPALLLFLTIAVAFFALVGAPLPVRDVVPATFYWANYHEIFQGWSHRTHDPPLEILWSLAIEEHFYFVFPLLLYALRRHLRALFAVLVAICVAVLAWRLYLVYGIGLERLAPGRTYAGTDTRIDSIVYGCLMSVLVARTGRARLETTGSWRWLGSGLAALLGAGLLLTTLLFRDDGFRESWRYSLQGLALMPLFARFIVLGRRDFGARFLASHFMVFVGKISYSLYLNHWLALCMATQIFRAEANERPIVVACALPMTLVLSLFSYYIVETPLRRWGHRLAEQASAAAPVLTRIPEQGEGSS